MKADTTYIRALALTLACALTAGGAAAQEHLVNAQLEMRSGSQGLVRTIGAVASAGVTEWVGYRVRVIGKSSYGCQSNDRIRLEPPRELYVLARLEAGKVIRLRLVAPECEIDAGGLPVVWINDVKASDSVEWLATLARSGVKRDAVAEAAVKAIGLHDDPSATQFFDAILK